MLLCLDLLEKICKYLPAISVYNFRCCCDNNISSNFILKSYINQWNNYNLKKRLKMIIRISLIKNCSLIFIPETCYNFRIFEITYRYPKISNNINITLIYNKIHSLYLDYTDIQNNQVIHLGIFKKKTCCVDKLNIFSDKNDRALCTGSLSCLNTIDIYEFKKQKFNIILNIQ